MTANAVELSTSSSPVGSLSSGSYQLLVAIVCWMVTKRCICKQYPTTAVLATIEILGAGTGQTTIQVQDQSYDISMGVCSNDCDSGSDPTASVLHISAQELLQMTSAKLTLIAGTSANAHVYVGKCTFI